MEIRPSSHVHVPLLDHVVNLGLGGGACEGEHADLVQPHAPPVTRHATIESLEKLLHRKQS
jgi:hypothetical protein